MLAPLRAGPFWPPFFLPSNSKLTPRLALQYAAQVAHHTRRRRQPRRGRHVGGCLAQSSRRVCRVVRQDGPPQALAVGRLARQGRRRSCSRSSRSARHGRTGAAWPLCGSSFPSSSSSPALVSIIRHALEVGHDSLGFFANSSCRNLGPADDHTGACPAPTPLRVPDLVGGGRFRARCPGAASVPVSLLVRSVRPLARLLAPAAVLLDYRDGPVLGRSVLFFAEWRSAGAVPPRHLSFFPRPHHDDVVLPHPEGTEPAPSFCGLPLATTGFVSINGNVPPVAATLAPRRGNLSTGSWSASLCCGPGTDRATTTATDALADCSYAVATSSPRERTRLPHLLFGSFPTCGAL